MRAGLFNRAAFAARITGPIAIGALFQVPNTNLRPRFEMQLVQNVLDVFLHSARAAPEDLSDIAIAFSGGDPFHDFELAWGEGPRRFGIRGGRLLYSGCFAVPGGHGKMVLAEERSFVYTHKGVYDENLKRLRS